MSSKKLFLWPAILVATALVVGGALLVLVKSVPEVEAPPRGAVAGTPPPRALPVDTGFVGSGLGAGTSFPRPASAGGAAAAANDETMAAWEKPISVLLDSDDENEEVAVKLAALGPTLPLEGYVECIQHMVNLLDDEQYKLATDMLMSPSLQPEVREVIFSDVLDRPNEVKVPALLALLGSFGHPLQGEAREKLQLLIGSDLGDNPVAWQVAATTFLARSAAEEQAAEAASEDFADVPDKD